MKHRYINGLLLAVAGLGTQAGAVNQVPIAEPAAQGALETVTVRSTGFAKGATNQVTSESAQCPGRSYTLRINREQKQVSLLRGDLGTSSDISSTAFGTTFLTKNLYGKFFFSCPSGVAITFWGFEAQRSGPPKAVEYILVIRDNGGVVTDSGLMDESYEVVNRHLVSPAQ